jgi:hypothetical protein
LKRDDRAATQRARDPRSNAQAIHSCSL